MRTLHSALILLVLCVLLSTLALAQLTGLDLAAPFIYVICSLWNAFVYVIPALGVMIFAVAGALWVYSQDDAGKRNAAKVWITHVIIGTIIATLALAIAVAVGRIIPGYYRCLRL